MISALSSAQLRAARGMLHWTVRDLAAKSGVHRNTVTRFETVASIEGPALTAIVTAFQKHGIEFDSAEGWVRVSFKPLS